ncbi:MAG: 2-dehydropantoate 2-reductase [Phycisphaerae bacterium]|nr:2-dehydropantoate 2-reductase [Phycisphaerae bacterium]
MRILVFGAGALGQAVGGLLADAGHDVSLLLRATHAEAIDRDGLRVAGIFGEHHIPPDRVTLFTDAKELLRAAGPFDFILVTVKSYDTPAAADALRLIAGGGSTVVSMQNGYGNVERLAAALGPDHVLCGRVITGFVIDRPGVVRITVHADAVSIGRFDGADSPHADALAEALSAAGLPARPSPRVQGELWGKILYNCALNPLGAILGVAYGRLGERAETRELMERIVREAYAVMAAHDLPRFWPTPEEFLRVFYERLLPPTAGHTPSMLQDLRAAKRTEIEALNGAIERLGRGVGIDTPANSAVACMVRFLEARGAAAP